MFSKRFIYPHYDLSPWKFKYFKIVFFSTSKNYVKLIKSLKR